jgi:hypothetical protein
VPRFFIDTHDGDFGTTDDEGQTFAVQRVREGPPCGLCRKWLGTECPMATTASLS